MKGDKDLMPPPHVPSSRHRRPDRSASSSRESLNSQSASSMNKEGVGLTVPRAWRVVLDAGFLTVCPIQPHFLRRICLATEKIRNEELWEREGQEPVAKQILRRKWGWIGHTLRKPASSTTRQALTWNPQGKRKRGRLRNSWRRDTEAGLYKQGTNWTGVARIAQNQSAMAKGCRWPMLHMEPGA
nr:hypothetical protein BaRGS_029668 [Batillaria attramentaria]